MEPLGNLKLKPRQESLTLKPSYTITIEKLYLLFQGFIWPTDISAEAKVIVVNGTMMSEKVFLAALPVHISESHLLWHKSPK